MLTIKKEGIGTSLPEICRAGSIYAWTLVITLAPIAHAQSNVEIYGIVDIGVTTLNHTAEGRRTWMQSGVSQGSRIGLSGKEDLGAGYATHFVLERSVDVANGADRGPYQTFIGMETPAGTVSLGRQYDFIGEWMPAYAVAANTPAGLLGWSLHSNAANGYLLDNRMWGSFVDNAIKYTSPKWNGWTFGGLYGFRSDTGSKQGKTVNLYAGYELSAFSGALSWIQIDDLYGTSELGSDEFALGVSYNLGNFRLIGNATTVAVKGPFKLRANTYEAGAVYSVNQNIAMGLGYQYQKRSGGIGDAQQITTSVDYRLSKRTDVYAIATYVYDRGYGAIAEAANGTSGGQRSQLGYRVGMRHRF